MEKFISPFSFTLALVAPVAVLCVSNADAAACIKFDGSEGESADKDPKGWFDLQSYAWGRPQSREVVGGGAGKVSIRDFSIVHQPRKAIS